MKSGTHSNALKEARELVRLDDDGAMPEMPVSRAAWARLFGTEVKAVEMAEKRLARALAAQHRLTFRAMSTLGPLARQRLALLNLLKRATTAGIAYGYALYDRADPKFFEHVRLLARDEGRVARLEERFLRDLEDATIGEL